MNSFKLHNVMNTFVFLILLLASFMMGGGTVFAEPAVQTGRSQIEAALDNIANLSRPGHDGYAAVWDGNKYVHCRRLADRTLRCEAAGSLMQPSLEQVLTAERVGRLTALGWRLDPSFGSYVQVFPADAQSGFVADKIIQVLDQAYGADIADLQVETTWVRSEPCPPRNGPSQNLAGIVNDSPIMAATAVHACAYKRAADLGPNLPINSTADLIGFYGARVTAEIQRLRINARRRVFAIFDPGIGYVQCRPDFSPPTIYCEAQSAQSWQALSVVLTPERIRRLHELGYADPGRAPNYSKTYATDQVDDAAIARELLTVLREVYGYSGQPTLKVSTEE
jgi:hypothetical protein